jgi:DNA-binding CsgD family transcriptional regulator
VNTAPSLAELERLGLVVRGRFRHPAAVAAVLGSMDPVRRADLHERAAGLAHADGRPAAEVAGHLLAAGRAGAPWAVSTLAEAARLALADARVPAAVDCLRLACEECDDEVQLAALLMSLVRAEWRLSPALPLPRLPGLVVAVQAGRLAQADAAVLVRMLLWHGRDAEARTVLKLLAEAGPPPHPESGAELRVTRQWLRFTFAPMHEILAARGAARPEPAAISTAPALRRLDGAAVLDSVLVHGPSDALAEDAERVLRITGLEDMGMCGVEFALLALCYAEMPDRAAPWCDKLIAEAEARQAPARRARLLAIRSEIALREGRLSCAEEYARTALGALSAAGWGVGLGACLSPLLTVLTATGRSGEAVELLNRPVPEAMSRSTFGLAYLRARGRVRLARADFEGALSDFLSCGDLMRRWDLDSPGLAAWRTDAAEAWLALGHPDRARPLLEEELARCDRRILPRAHGNALRLLARCCEPRERQVLLGQAVDILAEAGDRYASALALTDYTVTLAGLGYVFRAQVTGRRAWDLAAECGAEPLFPVLEPYCGPSESDVAAVLSEAEQRVAELAVQGLTNREIAQRLYITVSTVEQHLTKVYRKLGVTSRSDLAAAQAAQAFAS